MAKYQSDEVLAGKEPAEFSIKMRAGGYILRTSPVGQGAAGTDVIINDGDMCKILDHLVAQIEDPSTPEVPEVRIIPAPEPEDITDTSFVPAPEPEPEPAPKPTKVSKKAKPKAKKKRK